MFVVRTAGHVIDSAVLGSIEYAVGVLQVPLVVVQHPATTARGGQASTLDALDGGNVPGGFVRDVVERVAPSVLLGRREGLTRVDEFEARRVIETGSRLLSRYRDQRQVDNGELAIVGVTYRLADGQIMLREHLGDIGE